MSTDYDVVVVGARVAGAATALLLARAGVRVALVDRASYGKDTLSTHGFMRAGVLQLHRWGLLDQVVASATPAVRRTTFHYSDGESVEVAIRPDGDVGPGELPASLVKLPAVPPELPAVSQQLVMNMFRDEDGMMPLMKAGLMAMAKSGKTDPTVVARVTRLIADQPELPRAAQLSANGVNGRPFGLGEPTFAARRNQALRWRISEASDRMLHPVHIHGCQFRIVSASGQPPEAYRAGWKDIAPISDGGFSEILVNFPYPAAPDAPYMAHCHILEHEDSGMMAQFTIA